MEERAAKKVDLEVSMSIAGLLAGWLCWLAAWLTWPEAGWLELNKNCQTCCASRIRSTIRIYRFDAGVQQGFQESMDVCLA